MNKKIPTLLGFLIIIVLAVLVGGWILVYQYWWISGEVKPLVIQIPEDKAKDREAYNKTFELESDNYIFSISMKDCNDIYCVGGDKIDILEKETGKVIQTIKLPIDFSFSFDELKLAKNEDNILYGLSNRIIFDDFNFDNKKDLAIWTSNAGAYGGPTYDIYLYNENQKIFVFDNNFTRLASNYLGMFFVDKEKQEITTFYKFGCCYHEKTLWKVINNVPQKFYILIIDGEKEFERRLINGRWVETRIK